MRDRVVFYSKIDMTIERHLNNARTILENPISNNLRINDIMELYNIKLYFDNKLYLDNWDDDLKDKYELKIRDFNNLIIDFFLKNGKTISVEFELVEFQYQDSFWDLISTFNLHKKIGKDCLELIFELENFHIESLLRQRKLVDYLSAKIRKYFNENVRSAEILLAHFEGAAILSLKESLYFPSNITEEDKEAIIDRYSEFDKCNLNYIELAYKSQTIKLSDRLKLKLRKTLKRLNEEIFQNGVNAMHQGIQVSFVPNQKELFDLKYENNKSIYNYSRDFIDRLNNEIDIFFLGFAGIFRYINDQGCIELVTKAKEISLFENIQMRAKGEYFETFYFYHKTAVSEMQLSLYIDYLKQKNIFIEGVLVNIVNEFLNSTYNNTFSISLSKGNSTVVEKIRMLAPELESLLKQYKIFVEEGFIDYELLSISSNNLHLSEVKSIVKYKYVYGEGDEFLKIKYYFFSSQSMLYYLDKFKDKYQTFIELINNEKVKYNDFQEYQKQGVDYLLSQGYVSMDEDENIIVAKEEEINVIEKLDKEQVLSFWHYPKNIRNKILLMESKGIVKFENTLLTKEEMNFINYHLNNKFSNGLSLRNKYLHGSNTLLESNPNHDYVRLLKIAILVIFKINDDLNLKMYFDELLAEERHNIHI